MCKRNLYYVVSSHWDREWYETFQNFRYKLVDMMDEILAAMDSGELHGPFHADGQACMLEDYLEIRPEKKDILAKRLSQNMISAGPWYNLPDEFLISGEAMIKNFRLGHQVVESLGGTVSKAGYLSDMFGHISQMPQIFRGFGIKAAFVWRGTDREQRNIIWQGADGTKIPTYVFSSYGYGEYSIFVRLVDKDFYSDFDAAGFPERVEKFVKQECNANIIEPVLIFDGVDLLCWDKNAYKAFFDISKKMNATTSDTFISMSIWSECSRITAELQKHSKANLHESLRISSTTIHIGSTAQYRPELISSTKIQFAKIF